MWYNSLLTSSAAVKRLTDSSRFLRNCWCCKQSSKTEIFSIYSRRLHEQTENISVWLWHMLYHLIISCHYAVVALGRHVALWHGAVQRLLSRVPWSRPAFDKRVHIIIFSSQHIWPRLLNLTTYSVLKYIAYANFGFLNKIIIIITVVVVVVVLKYFLSKGFFSGTHWLWFI